MSGSVLAVAAPVCHMLCHVAAAAGPTSCGRKTPATGQLALHTKSTGPRQAARLPLTLTCRESGPQPHTAAADSLRHLSTADPAGRGHTAERTRAERRLSKAAFNCKIQTEASRDGTQKPQERTSAFGSPDACQTRRTERFWLLHQNVQNGLEGRAGRCGGGPLRPCTPVWPPRRAALWGRLVSLPGHLLF